MGSKYLHGNVESTCICRYVESSKKSTNATKSKYDATWTKPYDESKKLSITKHKNYPLMNPDNYPLINPENYPLLNPKIIHQIIIL